MKIKSHPQVFTNGDPPRKWADSLLYVAFVQDIENGEKIAVRLGRFKVTL